MITRGDRPKISFYGWLAWDANGESKIERNPHQVRREVCMDVLNTLNLPDEKHMPIEDMIFSEDLESLTVAEEILYNLIT